MRLENDLSARIDLGFNSLCGSMECDPGLMMDSSLTLVSTAFAAQWNATCPAIASRVKRPFQQPLRLNGMRRYPSLYELVSKVSTAFAAQWNATPETMLTQSSESFQQPLRLDGMRLVNGILNLNTMMFQQPLRLNGMRLEMTNAIERAFVFQQPLRLNGMRRIVDKEDCSGRVSTAFAAQWNATSPSLNGGKKNERFNSLCGSMECDSL